jgi:hypothetical protein
LPLKQVAGGSIPSALDRSGSRGQACDEEGIMKSAILTLLLVCLLVAIPIAASANQPAMDFALEVNFEETKFVAKEEVVRLTCITDERAAIPAVPIPFDDGSDTTTFVSRFDCLYNDELGKLTKLWRINRDFSRFT